LSTRPDDLYLVDVIEAAEHLAEMIQGCNQASFQTNDLLASAVQYRLIVIGEACARLQDETLGVMANAPFPQIRGFRNRLVHGYFTIDLGIVWEVASRHVPALASEAERALQELFPETYARLLVRRGQGEE
jgi:uncharacterized protein with HEPN domain